jgi:hypothetical protein
MKLTRKGAAILADDETFLFEDEMIEGVNIEYGNIENCKFDSVLRSKN